jgi:prepilin-type processing-associated H-X9-DG protein
MPFPSGREAEAGRARTCASNMRLIGAGLLAYCDDNDGNFPCGRADGCGWAGAIEPYVSSAIARTTTPEAVRGAEEAVWACPDDPTGPDRSVDPPGLALSYSVNATLTGDRRLPNCGTKRSRLTNPAATVLAFETRGAIVQIEACDEGGPTAPPTGWWSGVGNGMANALQPGGISANLEAYAPIRYETGDIGARGCRTQSCLAGRHSVSGRPGANYLAADGHVAWEPPARVSSGNTPGARGDQAGGPASGSAASTDRLGKRGYALTFSAR